MNNRASSRSGFTLVEIMIAVGIIGLVAAIAVPNFVRARLQSNRTVCLNNLRQIDSAVQQWAAEERKAPSDIPDFTDISPYLKNVLVCPSGGTSFSDSYTLPMVTNKPACLKAAEHVLPETTS